jgi:hypothetical protein
MDRAVSQVVCQALAVRSAASWIVWDVLVSPERRLGKIRFTFEGTTMLATCGVHRDCKLALSVKPDLGLGITEVEADVTTWLAVGAVVEGSDAHRACGEHIKVQIYRMKLRRR